VEEGAAGKDGAAAVRGTGRPAGCLDTRLDLLIGWMLACSRL
jgi:hypothetical protein